MRSALRILRASCVPIWRSPWPLVNRTLSRSEMPGRGVGTCDRSVGAGFGDLHEQLRLGIDLLRHLRSVGRVKLADQPVRELNLSPAPIGARRGDAGDRLEHPIVQVSGKNVGQVRVVDVIKLNDLPLTAGTPYSCAELLR